MLPTPEFTIEHSSLSFQLGAFHHAHFRLRDERIRAVALKELAYLPIETRDDPDVLGKQWAALRGLYNAGVDFLYTVSGLFAPAHIGVVQFYGAAAEAGSEGAAVAEVERRMAAVEATLAQKKWACPPSTPKSSRNCALSRPVTVCCGACWRASSFACTRWSRARPPPSTRQGKRRWI